MHLEPPGALHLMYKLFISSTTHGNDSIVLQMFQHLHPFQLLRAHLSSTFTDVCMYACVLSLYEALQLTSRGVKHITHSLAFQYSGYITLLRGCPHLQAVFLARLVGPDAAIASVHSSLKSISGCSPGIQLAARHCFFLEDPSDGKKEPVSAGSERYLTSCGAYMSLEVSEYILTSMRYFLSC